MSTIGLRRLAVAALSAGMAGGALAAVPATAPAAPAKRIAALSPFSANTLAGLGVRPVGIGMTLGGADRFSARLRGVTRLPLSHPNGPNMEQLARLRPDLVLSSAAWSRGFSAMRQLGMTVRTTDPTRVTAIPAETRRLGALVGRSAQAATAARRQQADIAAATRGIATRPSVLLVLGVGRTPYAFLPSSWGGDVVTRAGGRLLTEGLSGSGGYAKISDEVVVAKDPDVIIAVPHGNPDDLPRLADYLRANPAWQTTTAARTGRVFVATGNSLLQPYTDVGRTLRDVRSKYLKNG